MRRTMTGLLAAAALAAAPVADGRAQTAQDTLGRVLEGLQGNQQDQRRDDRGAYRDRDDDRRRDDRGYRGEDRRRDDRGYGDGTNGTRTAAAPGRATTADPPPRTQAAGTTTGSGASTTTAARSTTSVGARTATAARRPAAWVPRLAPATARRRPWCGHRGWATPSRGCAGGRTGCGCC